jgi:glycosyltransferase involved in cell wall biosynthesis
LDRRRFGVEEASAQFWFRARMVERLAAHADHLVVLPRPTIMNELVDLIGLDADDVARRVTVVPEGVDVGEVERAGARLLAGHTSGAVARVLRSIPVERRGLPWIITVGRLHPSKGPQRIVDAVAADPALSERVNVVLVGGDIVSPSADEQSTIELVRRAARDSHAGLVTLTGHLPPAEVSDLVAHVVATGGIYVAASDKEEFGLAIVEALAAGAVVVAPRRGGPSTYVEDGRTGVLCDASTAGELTAAIAAALALVPVAGRAERARAMVRDSLSVDRMAELLGDVYRRLVPSKVSA